MNDPETPPEPPTEPPEDPSEFIRRRMAETYIGLDPFHPGHTPEVQFDSWFILRVVEPFTHWFQKYFGPDCFSWSKFFYRIALWMQVPVLGMLAKSLLENRLGFLTSLCMTLYLLLSFLRMRVLSFIVDYGVDRTRERVLKYMGDTGGKNPLIFSPLRRMDMFKVGIVAILYFPTKLIAIEDEIGLPTYIFFGRYFMIYLADVCSACTPLKPGKTKWQEFKERARETAERVFGGSPEPVPA